MPIGVSQDVLAEMVADETIDPKNENVFQNESSTYENLQDRPVPTSAQV
jgi:hypothetical protein